MTLLLDSLFNGLSIGTVLLIAALGLAIVFGLMGVINMAHGELMMLGAYTTFVVQNAFRPLGDPWRDLYIFPALVAAFAVTALVGLALERGVIRFLYGRPLETLLATWGVSLILQQFVRSVNWVLAFRLGAFAVLFFGGWWLFFGGWCSWPGERIGRASKGGRWRCYWCFPRPLQRWGGGCWRKPML
jgi:urea transport system permease protein